jgi:hypothetical protein
VGGWELAALLGAVLAVGMGLGAALSRSRIPPR